MPRKAAMLEFETDAYVEFQFYLAEKLGRTVFELDEMPNDEFVHWIVYMGRKAQRKYIENERATGRR